MFHPKIFHLSLVTLILETTHETRKEGKKHKQQQPITITMSEYGYEPEKVGIVRGLTRQLSRERLMNNNNTTATDPNRPPRGLTRSLSGDKLLDRRRSSRANHGVGGGLGLTRSSSGDRLSLRRGGGNGGSKGSLRNLFGSSFSSNLNNSHSKINATWDNEDDEDDEDDDDHRPSGGGLRRSGSTSGSFRNLRESLSRGFNNNSGNLSNQNEEFDNDDDTNNNNSFGRRSAFSRTKNTLNTFSIRGASSSLSRSFNNLNASSFSKKDMEDYDGVDLDGLEREMKSKKGLESREQTLLLLCKELGLMDE